MARALRILFQALANGVDRYPTLFSRIRLHFIGTDYAPARRAQMSVLLIAEQAGVADYVTENPGRVSYFESLSLLKRADFLLLVGSDDGRYTPSKVFPYILSRKPLLAVLHEDSSAAPVLEKSLATKPILFGNRRSEDSCTMALLPEWRSILHERSLSKALDEKYLQTFAAPSTTGAQCRLFDEVLEFHELVGGRLRRSP